MTDLWEHQERMIAWAQTHPQAAWWAGMGSGKTRAALEFIDRTGFERVLVVAPKTPAISVWPYQVQTWTPDIPVLDLTSMSVKNAATALSIQNADRFVALVNYDRLWRMPLLPAILKAKFQLVIADEAHRLKAAGSKVSRAAHQLSKVVEHRLAMTGTPMSNGPLDLYGQMRFVDDTLFNWVDEAGTLHRLSTNYGQFQNHFAVMGGYLGYEVQGYVNQEFLWERLNKVVFEVKTEDVVDLPDTLDITIPVQMGAEARKLYTSLARDFIAEHEGAEFIADNVLVKTLRLRQLSGGFIQNTGQPPVAVHTAKLEALSEVVDELGAEPFVVFATFTWEVDAIRALLEKQGIRCSLLTGAANMLKDWDAGKTQALIAQISAGAEGIDLTRAGYAIYYSLTYSLLQWEQSRARLRRPNADLTRTIRYITLLADESIDREVFAALQDKADIVRAIVRGLTNKYKR